MDSYYQKLYEQERDRIRSTVKLVAHEGHKITTILNGERTVEYSPVSAEEAAALQNTNDHKLVERLKDSVRINPETGHPTDLDFLAQHCRDIPAVPISYRPLSAALYGISEVAADPGYPRDDRQRIIEALRPLLTYSFMDVCTHGQIDRALYALHRANGRR